tara:strand:+ start:10 stop:1494 length:1485 start_codon:yes stop_codon:yes gene_type:complete
MATNSTQRYVDNEKSDNFLSGILPLQERSIIPVQEEVGVDIDLDIEKQIAQLQEAKMQTGIKKVVPVDFDTELGTFFSSIAEEKKDLEEKVAKDEKKITELEKLFSNLKKEKQKVKKKKELLLEPQVEQVEIKVCEKCGNEECICEHFEEPNEIKEAEQKSAASIMEYLLPKEVEEYNEDIIGQVSKQLSEMQVATEADKDKIKNLKSIDSLEKLKTEFLSFKDIVAKQMSFTGGGLDTNKISADLMPTTGSTYDLGSAARPWRKLFLSGGTLIVGDAEISGTEIAQLDGVTAGTITASKAVIVDSSKDISGFRNVTLTGELDAATLDISGNADIDGTLETDALSINGTAVTSTASELNILDGVTSTTAELNILDGVTSTAVELNILDGKSFVDEDNMASDSATAIASQQSIKAYVDGQISGVSTAPFLFTADDEGSGSINLTNEDRLTIRGGTGVSTVTTSGTILTINVDNTILTTTTGSTKGFAIAQAVALG